jgi:Ca-activated chloride channel family protein
MRESLNKIPFIFLLILAASESLFCKDDALKLFEQGNYEAALRKYDRVIQEHPEWEEAYFGKGAALYKSGRIGEALSEFEKAISLDNPMHKSAVFYNMGNALFNSNKLEDALKFYKKALELNPTDFDAKHNFELVKSMLNKQNSQNQGQNQDKDKQDQDKKENKDSQERKGEENKEKEQQQNDQGENEQRQKSKGQQNQNENKEQSQQKIEREKSREEAAQILDALKDEEKNLLRERMKTKYSGLNKEKDW